MKIFDEPCAAMHAYELSLKRQPRSEPFIHRDVPTLWERTKAMFAELVDTITSAAVLARRTWIARKDRRDLLSRLVPLEWLVRTLLIVEATTHLLMTRDGARLRAETPKIDPPPPPKPVGVKAPNASTRILMPGWHTIAALRPVIDPRIVEREQREAAEQRRRDVEAFMRGEPADPASDPSTWNCRLNVLRWVHPDDPDAPPPQPKPAPLAKPPFKVFSYEDTNFPTHADLVIRAGTRAHHDDDSPHQGRDLARRIEALARIIANPLPAIRRLARRLAALKADNIDPLPPTPKGFNRNMRAFNENISARRHEERAFIALLASEPCASEPGRALPGHKHEEG